MLFETTAIFARFFRLTRYFNWKSKNLFILLQAQASVLHQGQSPQAHWQSVEWLQETYNMSDW